MNTLLTTAPSLAGVSVLFGQEEINEQNRKPPAIVVYPFGGSISGPGTPPRGLDPTINMLWEVKESIYIHCWGYDFNNPTNLNHYNKADTLRQNVLRALQYQRYEAEPESPKVNIGPGYWFEPVNEQWSLADNAQTKFGAVCVIEVVVKILILDVFPLLETITGINIEIEE